MKYSNLFLVVVAATALVLGCKKDDDDPTGGGPAPVVTNPLRQVFADNLENATQQFTVTASTGGIVQGQDGVYIGFAPNAFRYQNGSTATGAVQIELVEALEVGDMLWINKQTLGNDNGQLRPLVSGGQFYLNATLDGQQLRLVPGATFVSVPTTGTPDPTMELFSGTVDSEGTIIWDPFANPAINALDSSSYGFVNDSLGWVNCDVFMYNGNPQSTVQVTCPTGYSHENTFVWIVFPAENSITNVMSGTGNVFATGNYELPIGMNIVVVTLSSINGAITSSFTNAVVTAGMNLTVDPQPTTLTDFATDAAGL